MTVAASTIHTIGIAELLVVQAPDAIRTVLGSCVGVALHDPSTSTGGLAHIILPDSTQGQGEPGKFADTAIELLLEQMLGNGAVRGRIRAKLSGGARMFGAASQSDLGTRNIEAAKTVLSRLQIPVVAEDCGGGKGRKVTLQADQGSLLVQAIGEQPKEI